MRKKRATMTTQIRIDKELMEFISKEAEKDFCSKNAIINRIIAKYFKDLGLWGHDKKSKTKE